MTLSRTNKILLAVLIAAVASAGYWFLVLAPKRQEAAKLESDIAAKQRQVVQAQTQLATYERARTHYRANYAKLATLGKAVPADDDVRSLMVQLDSTSNHTNVEFQKVDVGGSSSSSASAIAATDATKTSTPGTLAPPPGTVPVGSTGVSALPFTLTFGGSFLNLSGLFTRLDRYVSLRNQKVGVNGRLLRIESFSITPASSGWPRMTAQVGAASYVATPAGSAGASGATPAGGSGTPSSSGTTPASSGGSTTPSTTTATVTGAAR